MNIPELCLCAVAMSLFHFCSSHEPRWVVLIAPHTKHTHTELAFSFVWCAVVGGVVLGVFGRV